jgi:prepilin peptidase CpaA
MWDVWVMAFAVAAAVGDALWRKIPNKLVLAGLLVGLAYNAFHHQFLSALIGCGLGFVVGLALFYVGAIGGGDVKLLMALGALLGYHRWFTAMEFSILTAALIAAAQVFRRHAARQVIHNMGEIARELTLARFGAHPVINVRNAAMIRAPFGVAAAVGTCVALLVK